MPRPTTKEQLLLQSQAALDELLTEAVSLSAGQRDRAGACGEWSVKDVLAHLHAWHELFLVWYREGMAGGKPAVPAPGFSFKDTPALNEKIYQENKNIDFAEVVSRLKQSHRRVIVLAEGHTDTELFTKQSYPWTASTSLGAYFIGCLSSHYEWAHGLVKKYRRGLEKMPVGDKS